MVAGMLSVATLVTTLVQTLKIGRQRNAFFDKEDKLVAI